MPDESFCDLHDILLPANALVIGLLRIYLLVRKPSSLGSALNAQISLLDKLPTYNAVQKLNGNDH